MDFRMDIKDLFIDYHPVRIKRLATRIENNKQDLVTDAKQHFLDRLAAPPTSSLLASPSSSQKHASNLIGGEGPLLLGRKARLAVTILRAVRAELGVVAAGDDELARVLAEVSLVVGGGLCSSSRPLYSEERK